MIKTFKAAAGLALALVLAVGLAIPGSARITTASSTDVWCVGPSGAEVCVDSSGNLISTTTNDADLGTSSLVWNELHLNAGGLTDAAVVAADLADGSVTTAKLDSDAVTSAKIINAAVATEKLRDGAVLTDKIAVDAVIERKLINGAVTSSKVATDAIITAKLINAAVTTPKLEAGAVTTSKMYLDLPSVRAVCVTSTKILGLCSSAVNTDGSCTCS